MPDSESHNRSYLHQPNANWSAEWPTDWRGARILYNRTEEYMPADPKPTRTRAILAKGAMLIILAALIAVVAVIAV